MKRIFIAIFVTLLTMASTSFAATQAVNTNTVAPTLQVQATVQKAVQLTLSVGTSTAAHCAVAAGATTDYKMDFGTVDALAINNGNCGKFAPTTPGATDAIYWSDYDITPVFASHAVSTNTITAQVTTNFGAPNNLYVVRDTANSATVPTAIGQFSAMGVASADTIATNATSGTALTRFIGVGVKPLNAANAATTQTATVTFTLTVQ